MENDLILSKLDNALKQYYNQNNQKESYNLLFIPVQKASKILLENNINIFNLEQEKNLFDEDLNGLGKLLASSVKARNILVESNLGLVRNIANKYAQKFPQLEYGDAESEGVFGLLKAIAKFKPYLNVPFFHYALPVIDNHVKINLNKYLRTIKLPVNFIFDYRVMKKFENEFRDRFRIKPNDEELAEFRGKPVKYVKRLKRTKQQLYDVVSLDTTPMFKEDNEDYLIDNIKNYLIDSIIDINSFFEDRVLNKIIFQDFVEDFIKEYILKIPDRSKSVLLEQLKGKTLEYIAFCPERLNIKITDSKKVLTRERIQQISKKGIQKIKASKKFKKKRLKFNSSNLL